MASAVKHEYALDGSSGAMFGAPAPPAVHGGVPFPGGAMDMSDIGDLDFDWLDVDLDDLDLDAGIGATPVGVDGMAASAAMAASVGLGGMAASLGMGGMAASVGTGGVAASVGVGLTGATFGTDSMGTAVGFDTGISLKSLDPAFDALFANEPLSSRDLHHQSKKGALDWLDQWDAVPPVKAEQPVKSARPSKPGVDSKPVLGRRTKPTILRHAGSRRHPVPTAKSFDRVPLPSAKSFDRVPLPSAKSFDRVPLPSAKSFDRVPMSSVKSFDQQPSMPAVKPSPLELPAVTPFDLQHPMPAVKRPTSAAKPFHRQHPMPAAKSSKPRGGLHGSAAPVKAPAHPGRPLTLAASSSVSSVVSVSSVESASSLSSSSSSSSSSLPSHGPSTLKADRRSANYDALVRRRIKEHPDRAQQLLIGSAQHPDGYLYALRHPLDGCRNTTLERTGRCDRLMLFKFFSSILKVCGKEAKARRVLPTERDLAIVKEPSYWERLMREQPTDAQRGDLIIETTTRFAALACSAHLPVHSRPVQLVFPPEIIAAVRRSATVANTVDMVCPGCGLLQGWRSCRAKACVARRADAPSAEGRASGSRRRTRGRAAATAPAPADLRRRDAKRTRRAAGMHGGR